MKSKELNEIFNKTRRTPNISLTPEQVEELIKDLEVLEILKEWCLKDFIEYSPNDYGWVEFPLTIYDTDTEEEANKKKIVVDYLKKC